MMPAAVRLPLPYPKADLCRPLVLLMALSAGAACSPDGAHRLRAPPAESAACLPGERGFLRASLHGAIEAELDWRGTALQCDGGARPDVHGLRLSFLGPQDAHSRRLRLVFGIDAQPGLGLSRSAPTNVTVILEGQNRLYATQGDDKCTIESLVQEAVTAADRPANASATRNSSTARIYRVAARGYCIDPAATLDGTERLYINRFDFAGLARFEDNELHVPPPHG
jgi:hypothetical protein